MSDSDQQTRQATSQESLLLMCELCEDVAAEFLYFGGDTLRSKAKAEVALMMAIMFNEWAQEHE